jgi:hypothetical protein
MVLLLPFGALFAGAGIDFVTEPSSAFGELLCSVVRKANEANVRLQCLKWHESVTTEFSERWLVTS